MAINLQVKINKLYATEPIMIVCNMILISERIHSFTNIKYVPTYKLNGKHYASINFFFKLLQ